MLTVLRAGTELVDADVLSNPTTASSSGIANPATAAAESRPSACSSVVTKTAAGRVRVASHGASSEAASALGTVGQSMGQTARIALIGKLIVCLTMFAGRIGPFALAASLLGQRKEPPPTGRQRILLG